MILVLVSYDLTKTDKDEEELFIHIESRLNVLSERQYQIFKMKVTADIIFIKWTKDIILYSVHSLEYNKFCKIIV